MSPLLPPRPRYAKEHALFGYPLLACFALLFTVRIADTYMGIPLDSPALSLLLPLLVFLLPALIFIRARGKGYTRTLRLRRPYATHVPLLIAALFALFCGCVLLSILFGGIGSLGNSQIVFEESAPQSPWGVLISIPLLGILPAVLEELMFRGILCTELDRRGGLLFALSRLNCLGALDRRCSRGNHTKRDRTLYAESGSKRCGRHQ